MPTLTIEYTTDTARLPYELIRTTIAAIAESERFGQRLRTEADRLGVTTLAAVTALGDGAEWIWNLAEDHLPQATGVLDVFHAVEHIGAAVKAVGPRRRSDRGPDRRRTGGVAGRGQAGRGALARGCVCRGAGGRGNRSAP